MCGIVGLSGFDDNKLVVEKALSIMKERGKDASKIFSAGTFIFGHNLHSIIDYVEQPLVSSKGILVANCEIYNWKVLAKKYSIDAKNDAELLLKIFDKKGLKNSKTILSVVEELDGDFAFAYYSIIEKKIILARDIAGVKPLIYSFDKKKKHFAFASEKKAFSFESQHLNPRKIIIFDEKKSNLDFIDHKIKNLKLKNPKIEIKEALFESVKKRTPEKPFGLLLSGGIDSLLLGKIFIKQGRRFKSYFAGIKDFSEPKDLEYARKAAREINSELIENLVSVEEFEKELPKIISLIESTDPIRVGVASTIYFATKKCSEKIVFSGLGADELFAGYNRFKNSTQVNKDCYSYFIKMYENDLYFEDIITMKNLVELRVPYLDKELIEKSLTLNPKLKIDSSKNKIILREIAFSLGVRSELSDRPKKAAQYGSNFDKALEFLAKKNSFKSKADYLNSLAPQKKNIPIAALVSTGKDSLYALYLMQKQGYEIKCLITIDSKNKDSFMYHTPTISLANLQAKTMNLPLIVAKTEGEKEDELMDLEKAIVQAKNKYKIEGVCSGALYSNYQRERIEKICENLGIRSFAPLWHMNQLIYLKQLVACGFEAIITKIACYKLDENWLGKKIDIEMISKLEKLQNEVGVNPAGEGGEYETLVLNAPMFKSPIKIISSEKKMQNEFTGELKIIRTELV